MVHLMPVSQAVARPRLSPFGAGCRGSVREHGERCVSGSSASRCGKAGGGSISRARSKPLGSTYCSCGIISRRARSGSSWRRSPGWPPLPPSPRGCDWARSCCPTISGTPRSSRTRRRACTWCRAGGRFELGIGAGWYQPEYAQRGSPLRRRAGESHGWTKRWGLSRRCWPARRSTKGRLLPDRRFESRRPPGAAGGHAAAAGGRGRTPHATARGATRGHCRGAAGPDP